MATMQEMWSFSRDETDGFLEETWRHFAWIGLKRKFQSPLRKVLESKIEMKYSSCLM